MPKPRKTMAFHLLHYRSHFHTSPYILISYSIFSCNPTHPSQHSHLCHMHPFLIAYFGCPALSPIQHHRPYGAFIYFAFDLNWHLAITRRAGELFPFHPSRIHSSRHIPVNTSITL
ncbi:hypothetical protein JYU34_009607 [Plutella xylostella]|uniref:Uncharacterized protein n=1 Tax=Plutella xylostella TaxID=51655 RepID=A0ABQ7QK45_PLUXY|nr:hypothetical protein JYU34_009607 [Plutella xylostella]